MKNIILLSFVSLILFSCAKKNPNDNSSSHELVGTWKTSCLITSDNQSRIFTLIFTNSERTWQLENYYNDDCTGYYRLFSDKYNSLTFGDIASYPDGYQGHEISFIQESLNLTPTDSIYTDYLNENNRCGMSDWEMNKSKDYAGKVCWGDSQYTNGSSWYGKYALKGNNLYITAISQDSAPTELISRIYSKQ